MQSRIDIFDEGNRKRGHPAEITDGLESAKRMRLGADIPGPGAPLLPPGPVSVAQLYTLTSDEGLASFDVTTLPIELVVRITLPVLHQINQASLDEAINAVRARYNWLTASQRIALENQNQPVTAPEGEEEEEEDDYEPDFQPVEDPEQLFNKDDTIPSRELAEGSTEVALGAFKLQKPPPLTQEESYQIGKNTVTRVFGMINVLEAPSSAKRQKPGLNRLAGSNYDREAWITIITRLATRASGGLDEEWIDDDDYDPKALFNAEPPKMSLSDSIRENLWKYIVEDFRARIHIAIGWLNEEWLNDRLQARQLEDSRPLPSQSRQSYEKWVLKILDFIIPYLDAKDKLLIRFLSEIPAIDELILERVKGLARDPERVVLAVSAIQ